MNVETILTAAITVITALGGVSAYFWKSRGNSILKLQAIEIDTLTGKNKRLEDDGAAKDARIAALGATITNKDEQIATLKELAQGSPQLKTLTNAIEMLTRTINNKIIQGIK